MKKHKEPKKVQNNDDYFEIEEKYLTNFRNKDKIIRKENKW